MGCPLLKKYIAKSTYIVTLKIILVKSTVVRCYRENNFIVVCTEFATQSCDTSKKNYFLTYKRKVKIKILGKVALKNKHNYYVITCQIERQFEKEACPILRNVLRFSRNFFFFYL